MRATFTLDAAMISDRGRKRRHNEDNYFLDGRFGELRAQPDIARMALAHRSDNACQLFAVCDGMGGAAHGEEASLIAAARLQSLRERMQPLRGEAAYPHAQERIRAYAQNTSHIVRQKAEQYGADMGTTLALLCMLGNVAIAANVGDSRVYLLRGGKFIQLSIDQTDAERKARQGVIRRGDIATHAGRNRLIQFIGQPSEAPPEPCIRRGIEVMPGDRFLLCSDGLTDLVADDRIKSMMQRPGGAQRTCARLVDAAIEAGGIDNVTVIVVQVGCGLGIGRWIRGWAFP